MLLTIPLGGNIGYFIGFSHLKMTLAASGYSLDLALLLRDIAVNTNTLQRDKNNARKSVTFNVYNLYLLV